MSPSKVATLQAAMLNTPSLLALVVESSKLAYQRCQPRWFFSGDALAELRNRVLPELVTAGVGSFECASRNVWRWALTPRELARSRELPARVADQLATAAKDLARGKAKLQDLDSYAKLLSLRGIAGNVKSALVARYRSGSVTADAFKKAAADAVSIKSEDELMGAVGTIISWFLPGPAGTILTIVGAVNDIKGANDRVDIAKAGALAGATERGQRAQAKKDLRGAVAKGAKDLLFARAGGKVIGKAGKALRLPGTVGNAANTLLGSQRQPIEDKVAARAEALKARDAARAARVRDRQGAAVAALNAWISEIDSQ